jgi:hypothetical protein
VITRCPARRVLNWSRGSTPRLSICCDRLPFDCCSYSIASRYHAPAIAAGRSCARLIVRAAEPGGTLPRAGGKPPAAGAPRIFKLFTVSTELQTHDADEATELVAPDLRPSAAQQQQNSPTHALRSALTSQLPRSLHLSICITLHYLRRIKHSNAQLGNALITKCMYSSCSLRFHSGLRRHPHRVGA